MNFDRLPNEIRLKILLQLPFRDRVRLARVRKRFQQMSRMAVSTTSAINLTAGIFDNAEAKSMSRLIKSCAGNLRLVVMHGWGDGRQVALKRIKTLSRFPCPRLEELDLGCGRVKYGVLRNLLRNSPKLRSLKWRWPRGTFPPGVVCEKLEEVDIRRCTTKFFKSLVQSFPNLKHIVLSADSRAASKRWEQVLNEIFASKPELESLKLRDSLNRIRIDQLGNLRSLAELRSLSLHCHEISDEMMIAMSENLRQLERLSLESSRESQRKVSSRGIEALSRLQHLRDLDFEQHPRGEIDIDRGARRLAECGRLRKVRLTDRLGPATVLSFIQHCPLLRLLSVRRIEGVDATNTAKEFVESLTGFVQEHLAICFEYVSRGYRRIWQSKEVKSAVRRVNATANGRSIWIIYWLEDKWGGGDYINIGPSMGNRIAETWDEWSEWDEEENTLQLIFGDDASTAVSNACCDKKGGRFRACRANV